MSKEQIGEELNINKFVLTYFLTKSEILSEGEKYIVYGIEIEKKSLSKVETSIIKDVTIDKIRAIEIVETIRRNNVTPVHLNDVMENFL